MTHFGRKALAIISMIACQSAFAKQTPYQSGDTITVVQAVAPFYPPLALAAHISGEVIVVVQLDRSGRVNDAKATEGHKLLSPTAERAAKRWLFAKAADGIPTRQIKLRFKFTLLDNKYASEDLMPIFRPPFETKIRDSAR